MQTKKRCTQCTEVKSLSEFHTEKHAKDGRKSRCKPCRRAQQRKYDADLDDVAKKRRRVRKKVYKHKRRFRELEGTLTPKEWEAVLNFYDCKCVYCGDVYEHLEHVRSLSRDGTHSVGNVVPSCAPCNLSKGHRNVFEWYKERFGEGLPEHLAKRAV